MTSQVTAFPPEPGQVTAIPPEPGDIEDKNVQLRAVNGSKIKTYGHKNITIKIGRKSYDFKAIKAEVTKPVIGWDFMKFHRLGLRWGQWGDLYLYDRKAQIHGLLDVQSVPREVSDRHHQLAILEKEGVQSRNLSIPFWLLWYGCAHHVNISITNVSAK